MMRTLLRLALGASFTVLALSNDAAAQGRGGGMSRGGGGGMQRGGGGGSGGYGGGMNHSPSFSQPHPPMNQSRPQGSSESSSRPPTSGSSTANSGNRNSSSSNPNAAAAGAGYAKNNQSSSPSTAGAAAAGAGAEKNNQPSGVSNAGAAAAGAGYSNRNQSGVSNAGAAAAGAGYANHNQSPYSNAGAAAAGAGYANRNGYDQYHPGMAGGYWNGNYGYPSVGSYGGMGMASPSYGYGSSPYMNPYAGAGLGGVGGGGQGQQGNVQGANSTPYNYSQPVDTSAAPPSTPPTDPSTTPAGQARQAFQAGDYAGAIQLTQQALGQLPNDVSLHEFLALALFAQGSYEQAAAPLYAVLSVGPGWNWTTLIGNYSDANVYTQQLRGLEAFVKANPQSAKAQFVEAYHYICQGQGGAAIKPLKAVVALQRDDRLSAQILSTLEPPSTLSTVAGPPVELGKLPGVWVAQAPPNAKITLTLSDDTNFIWAYTSPANPAVTIRGTFALANGVLTLSGKDTPGGPLAGQVTAPDDNHMTFKAVGGPSSDPGLQFAR